MSEKEKRSSSAPKQAAEALQECEVRSMAVIAAIPDLMFGFSREGEILYYNAPDESDLYERPEAFLGRRIDVVLPRDVGSKYRHFIRKTLEEGQIQQFEYKLPVPKGVQDFECRMVVSGRDEVLAIVRNVTEQKQAEGKLRESEARFRSIAENAVDCIFIKDSARKYTFVNPAMQELLGLPKEDILGKTPEDIFAPEQAQTVKDVDDRTFCGETVDETRILLLGSEEYFLHTLQTPLTEDDGEITSILGIVRDVTERKQTEKSDLHDSVGQQLAGLRFLLAGLRQELSVTHPHAAHRVAQIEQIAGDALASVRQITEGIERLSEEPDTLVTALRKLAYRVSDLYGVQCRFSSRKPVLIQNSSEANHLFLIAQEAVANAVKHAKPCRVTISLTERNGTLRLAIRDDGIGFSSEKKGRGMGLNIMRRRAALIGASMDIKPGKTGGTVVACLWTRKPPEA